MSNIIDSTDSIIGDIINDINNKNNDINSVIENSIFISVDDSAESKGIYTVTGCMPEVWGAIFHSHFRTMEEQLEQIIENTKISWLDYVLLGLTVVGTSSGFKQLIEWGRKYIASLLVTVAVGWGVATNTTDVQADTPEETPGTEPEDAPSKAPSTVTGVSVGVPDRDNETVGSPDGDTVDAISGAAPTSSILVGELGTGNVFEDYFTIGEGSQFFDDLKVIGSKGSTIFEGEHVIVYEGEEIIASGIPYTEGGTVLVGGDIDKGIDRSSTNEVGKMITGTAIVVWLMDAIRQNIQYVPRVFGMASNTTPGSENTVLDQHFVSANALGNGDIYSNSQNDLLDDNIKNNYNDIATQNNNSTVANNPTITNHFKIEVKDRVNFDDLFRDIEEQAETKTAGFMAYSGIPC